MTAEQNEGPGAGEYAALVAILRRAETGPLPIPLWRLNQTGLTAAQLKAALSALASRGCVELTYRAGLADAVRNVQPSAWGLEARWAVGRP